MTDCCLPHLGQVKTALVLISPIEEVYQFISDLNISLLRYAEEKYGFTKTVEY
jgi:hypothetical protein